jgi:hypothetical protein
VVLRLVPRRAELLHRQLGTGDGVLPARARRHPDHLRPGEGRARGRGGRPGASGHGRGGIGLLRRALARVDDGPSNGRRRALREKVLLHVQRGPRPAAPLLSVLCARRPHGAPLLRRRTLAAHPAWPRRARARAASAFAAQRLRRDRRE